MNRRSLSDYLVIVALAAIVALGVHFAVPSRSSTPTTGTGSQPDVFERITKSGVIRCGYVPYPPGLVKDPNTGKVSGVFVDALEEAATNLGLKVEWVEEVGWGSMIEGLQTDRYDMIGSPVWANSTRAKLADFSAPLFYSGIGVYVRSGDTRFTNDLAKLNDPAIRLATIDGEMSDIIARSKYAKAQRVSLPQLADNSQMLLNVSQGRADATFVEPYIAELFLKNNPGTLVNITPQQPIRIFPNTMMFRQGQERLKSMLDTALHELINSGRVNELFEKYDIPPGAFYLPAKPYETSSKSGPG